MNCPPRSLARRSARRGFTLIELLTVIAIIGILAAILIPVVGKVRDSARASQCTSNLRQVALALRLRADDNRSRLPPARAQPSDTYWFPASGFSVRCSAVLRAERQGPHVFACAVHDMVFRAFLDDYELLGSWESTDLGPRQITAPLELGRAHRIVVEARAVRGYTGLRFGWCPAAALRIGQDAALAFAAGADAAIVCAGFTAAWESEGYDRPFALDEAQVELIRAVAAVQPRTLAVLWAGAAVEAASWAHAVPALMFAGYPGQEGGGALADLILGHAEPAGRLPFTWEKTESDRSSYPYYRDIGGGRVPYAEGVFTGHRGAVHPPLFAFGHGLSTTRFDWSGLSPGRATITDGESFQFSLIVTNRGARRGHEVVQLYVGERTPDVPRPRRELKDFATLTLEPGAEERIVFTLPPRAFQTWDVARHAWRTRPGSFEIVASASATDERASTLLTIRPGPE